MNEQGVMIKYIGEDLPHFHGVQDEQELKYIEGELMHGRSFFASNKNGKTFVNMDNVIYIKFTYKEEK